MRKRRMISTLCVGLLVLAACSGGGSHDEQQPAGSSDAAEPPSVASVEEVDVMEDAASVPESDDVEERNVTEENSESVPAVGATEEVATFGAGCFWCVEAVLEQLDGVLSVSSGYMGGSVDDPTYEQVCSGRTGHAEVVQVTFDPAVISYDTLLAWFWKLHDPTTLNRQGADVGTQYRSAIFFHSDVQRATAEAAKISAQPDFGRPIVTEISAASAYYPADEYHQDYYRLNTSAGYCRAVIAPKLNKLGLDDLTE
jgi:peptide-methionine (S)-S-oxide reductase